VYEGEIEYENRLLDKFKFGERTSDKVIGYFAYFTLINGFEKYLFVSIEDMQKHAKKYSKNYKGGTDTWGLTDFNTMAEKTVLKRLLSKFGPLSIETTAAALAIQNDGGVIRMDKDGNFDAEFDGETIDADFNEFDTSNTPTAVEDGTLIDAETGEVLTDEQ
ncbi:recombinase RecT, partial [Veillonella caviae]